MTIFLYDININLTNCSYLLNFFLINFLNTGRKVAIKIQKLTPESQPLIVEEYRVLRDFSRHPNLPEFYGVYRKRSGKKTEYDQIWFVMEVSWIKHFFFFFDK